MKTAFKRVALVAAAALAIGGISAVSANAVPANDWTVTNVQAGGVDAVAETATQIAGTYNFVTLTSVGAASYTITGGATTTGVTAGSVAAAGTVINIATPAVGTITVTSYTIASGAAATSSTSTVTISVIASVPNTVYAATTVYGNSGSTTAAAAAAAATPVSTASAIDAAFSVTAPAVLPAGVVANWTLAENDANGLLLSAGNAKALAVSATIGTLATATAGLTAAGGYLSGTPSASGAAAFTLSNNGQSGVSTVTVAVNGTTVKTYSVTFSGAAAKIVLTAINPVVAKGTVSGVTANTNALEVQEFDAAGNAVAVNGAITLKAADSTIASAASPVTSGILGGTGTTALSSTIGGSTVTGLAVGTTTFTATDGTLTSNSVSVRVSSAVPTTVVYSTDAASYSAGAAGKLIITVSDAAGTLPAGAYTLATGAATASLAFAVAPSNLPAAVTLDDNGVSSASFNAPISDGTVSVGGTSTTSVTVTPASFTVASGASDAANAATDAANEATDAANAATDAANAAADSADAATQAAQDAGDKADAALAAVTALSQQVTTVLAKVAALAATLAKITKAIAALPKK